MGVNTMTQATIVATLTTPPSLDGKDLASLPAAVEWLEVRADLVGDLDVDWLRSHFGGKLLYSLRSKAEGGAFQESESERHRRLLENARRYDFVDLEGEHDLDAGLLAQLPPQKRVISWHGPAASSNELERRLEKFSAVGARIMISRWGLGYTNWYREVSNRETSSPRCRFSAVPVARILLPIQRARAASGADSSRLASGCP